MNDAEKTEENRLNPMQVRLLSRVRPVQAIAKWIQSLPARYARRPSAIPVTAPGSGKRAGNLLHPLPVRVMHWINAIAMIVMITSGWGIYDDYVIISGLHFPKAMRLGDWAAESLLWHFAGMWFLAINGSLSLVYGAATGRFRQRLLPIRVTDVLTTVNETLHFKIAHDDITHYNAVQKLLYIVVILAGIAQVLTGLAIWKPVQLWFLVATF